MIVGRHLQSIGRGEGVGVVCLFLAKFSSCVLLEVSIIVKEFLQYFTEIWGGSDRNNEMKFGPEKTKLWDRATHERHK